MTLYEDPQYSQPFTHSPVLLTVNHRAYVGIRVWGVDPTRFVVTMSACWATPERDPSSNIRWDLITNQCPNPRDGTVVVEEDGISLVGRFSFSVFLFIPELQEVYLHCRIRLCSYPTARCTANCDAAGPAIAGRKPPSDVISAGPFLRYDDSLDQGKGRAAGGHEGAALGRQPLPGAAAGLPVGRRALCKRAWLASRPAEPGKGGGGKAAVPLQGSREKGG
uniref:Pancreatic secretory granule membrane major glycoprotein GP2-like n=1 Tax=Pogona vitticeps TaxID=103695 RepID=A0ABM5ESE4_9SAUR